MNRLGPLVFAAVGVLLALIVMVELASSEASINRFALLLGVISFVVPFMSPLRGYSLMLGLGAYLELLKFGAWWQNARLVDMISLNLPPLCAVAGICGGTLVSMLMGRIQVTRWMLIVWGLAITAAGLVGIRALAGGDGNASLGDAANSSAYLMLVPATATLLNNREDWGKLLTMTVWIMLPAALYGIYQWIFGYPAIHEQFLAGYRGWAQQLDGFVQPAGTMNGPIAFGTTMAVCFCMVIIRGNLRQRRTALDWCLMLIYLAAATGSGRRSSLLLIVAFLCGVLFFRSWGRALLLYAAAMTGVVSLYLFASPLIYYFDQLNRETARKFDNELFLSRIMNTGTFTDRLLGFKNMATNPDLWSLFGADMGEDYGKFGHGMGANYGTLKNEGNYEMLGDDFVHDGLNKAIISYGAVPVLLILLLLGLFIFRVHRRQFAHPDPIWRSQLRNGVAFTFSIGLVLLTSQQAITIQPINMVVFMVIGAFVFMMRASRVEMPRATPGFVVPKKGGMSASVTAAR